MNTSILQQSVSTTYQERTSAPSLLTRFITWCRGQEESRLLWLGVILAAHGCILTPLTVMIVMFTGNNLYLFVLAIAAMGMTLVTNLAALPTKITIPLFVLSIVIDLAIVISCVFLVA
jgi:hypothetical protein